MKKVIVLYKSKYGKTQKYANWISEEVGADIYNIDSIKIKDLEKYDIIVYCGGLYVGGVLGLSFLKKNYCKLDSKKIIIVAVGATLKKDEAKEEVKAKNIPVEMQKGIEFFLLRGGISYKKMKLIDRFLMYVMVKSLKRKKPEELDDDAKGIIATYGKEVDFTNKHAIVPIVKCIKEN